MAGTTIVKDKTSRASIVTPKKTDTIEKWAAELLSKTIEQSTGSSLEIIDESKEFSGNVIFIGQTKSAEKYADKLASLDRDGFIIDSKDGKIIIVGKTPVGTEYGVYEFLERNLGVRWLFPGEIGTCIPKHESITIADGENICNPMFLSRQLSDFSIRGTWPRLNNNDKARFMRHNRMHRNLHFHHALYHLLPPKKYGESHPEFYPLINGKRLIPPEDDKRYWQPCFTAEGLAETVAERICKSFANNPKQASASIGINDTGTEWCQCPNCLKLDGKQTDSLGNHQRSWSYFTWANKVAELVTEKYPDKRLGFLAYSLVFDPPAGMELNPILVPYITYDRMKWLDPACRERDQKTTFKWTKILPEVGWYDYTYGDHSQGTPAYLAPRVYFHHMAEYIRWARDNGVKHYYAESYPPDDWHEGPKIYLQLKLLWNPDLDVDATLNDWYVSAVGPEAAPHLSAYFGHWEEIWTKRVPKTQWFNKRKGRGVYLDFRGDGYMDVFTPRDIYALENNIKQMRQKASGTEFEKRAAAIADTAENRLSRIKGVMRIRFMQENPEKFPWKKTIVKSTFNKSYEGWQTWQKFFAKGKFSVEKNSGHKKSGSILINAAGANNGTMVIMREIPVEKGKAYRFSAYLKTSGFEDDARVLLSLRFMKKGGGFDDTLGNFESYTNYLNDKDWKPVNLVVEIPENDPRWSEIEGVRIHVAVKNAGTGKCQIDDVYFGEIKLP